MFQRGVTDVQVVDVAKYQVILIIPLGVFLVGPAVLAKNLDRFVGQACGLIHGNMQDESSDALTRLMK